MHLKNILREKSPLFAYLHLVRFALLLSSVFVLFVRFVLCVCVKSLCQKINKTV